MPNFETLILILQTLGPFTVLVTVYFLVTELREQNRVARANARQNIADSHQKLALAGMKTILVQAKLKLRNNETLNKEENAQYLTYFSLMLRARENQHYQFKIGMLDEGEWESMLISFKTLFKEPKHLEIWDFIKITFSDDFVALVDEQINQTKLYG
ncbi:MAG: hypothetical protein CMD55_00700 [Gammaproteobacteria bacterium]|nr:hypothetical protein [Gammaproteobacteria bacterium]|tara:strand:- start:1226 stop:1696 length:471 start_codon:yes stop_codon:yes gene_type:complete